MSINALIYEQPIEAPNNKNRVRVIAETIDQMADRYLRLKAVVANAANRAAFAKGNSTNTT